MQRESTEGIKRKARKIADDESKLSQLIDMVRAKLDKLTKNEKLKELFNTLEVLIRMIRSYINGEYRDYPKKTLIIIAFGLLYFLTPIDAIPDFIPLSGFIDDLSILLWVYRSIQSDIEKYLLWEEEKKKQN